MDMDPDTANHIRTLSLHSISISIGQVLFKRGDVRDIFNQTNLTANVMEG